MINTVSLYKSSIGQKVLIAVAGIALCAFLVVHLSGNLLLFKNDGGVAYDLYSRTLSTNPAIRAMEVVLGAVFLIHIIFAVQTWIENRLARPVRYAMNRPGENSELSSRIMFITGSGVFIFLVVHLRTFFVPTRFAAGVEPSMYQLVHDAFSNVIYDVFYLIALVLLGYHLRHGFQSAFQTLGITPKRIRLIDAVSVFFWLVIPAGFATMPLYFFWLHLKGVN
jgi:succinate dehydrogenase / fumarate reductase cytochrome b subunit